MNDKDYAIVVGISKYGSIRPDLEGPEADAKAFADWLCSETGGGLPKDNVGLVLSSCFRDINAKLTDPDDLFRFEPTIIQVTAEFAKLIRIAVQNSQKVPRVGRRLYIYLSGHGITPRLDPAGASLNASALLMANCVEDVIHEHISGQTYTEWFRLSHAFDEILLFMDCCRTDMPDVPPMPITTPIVGGGRPTEVQVFYGWSTQWDALAWEQPFGDPPQKRGVFTYALLEALESGPPDAQNRLTTKGIVGYLDIRVPQLRKGDGSQRPQFHQPASEIVIVPQVKASPADNVTITFGSALHGQQVELQDGSLNPVLSHTASDQPWRLSLSPGAYVLVIGGNDRPFTVRPSEVTSEHYDS
jgi:uncharacterized caspase-like protein